MDISLKVLRDLVIDREAWHPAVHGVAKSQTRLSNFTSLHFRYADDTTLRAESEEELKSLLMKVKEESERLA